VGGAAGLQEVTQIDRDGVVGERAGLREGEILEIVHDPLLEQRLLVERGEQFGGRLDDTVPQGLQIAAQIGERGAQLVRDVTGEAALALLTRLEGVGHAVEGAAELRDLVPAQDGYAARQVALAQSLRGQRDGADGAQYGPAQQQGAEDDRESHPHRDGHGGRGGQGGR
jgi:hypothetical protein